MFRICPHSRVSASTVSNHALLVARQAGSDVGLITVDLITVEPVHVELITVELCIHRGWVLGQNPSPDQIS